jgi:UDP-N-acetylmuramoyl-tripeptide--D-alanyl-D-alanine ligase
LNNRYSIKQMIEDLAYAEIDCSVWQYCNGFWSNSVEIDVTICGAEIDSRKVTKGCLFVGLQGENVDGSKFAETALVNGATVSMISDYSLDSDLKVEEGALLLQVPDTTIALTALAVGRRKRIAAKIIAITGTNGKTTTKDLLASCLSGCGKVLSTSGNYNNEIGMPLTILRVEGDEEFVVLEMGASASGDISTLSEIAKPDCGIITNASGAHLEGFGSLKTIIETKGDLIGFIPEDGFVVLNRDTAGFTQWQDRATCEVISFGEVGQNEWQWTEQMISLADQDYNVPLPGKYNGCNLVSAVLTARRLGCNPDQIRQGLKSFQPSEHRGQLINVGNIQLFDDCYNSNPESLVTSATAVKQMSNGRTIAIVGEMAELGDESKSIHNSTGHQLYKTGIDVLIGVGKMAEHLVSGFSSAGGEAFNCSDCNQAATWILKHRINKDLILIKGSRSAKMELVISRYLFLVAEEQSGVSK